MKYKVYRQKMSLSLVVVLLVSSIVMPSGVYSQKDVTKYETIYANLEADGKEKETFVSNWLKDSRFRKDVLDKTSASNVNNVTNDITPIRKNDDMLWKTEGKDVYYSGKTEKSLPITTRITYFLDGKEMKPEDMVGKSGKVKIHIEFINNSTKSVLVNGKEKVVSTPFTVATVIGLDNEKFANVEADNTKIFSDGNRQMVTFMGFPGLEGSLNIKNTSIEEMNDIDIPDEFTITADAKDFELNSIALVATPKLPDMIKDIKNIEDIQQVKSDIDVALYARDTLNRVDPEDTIKDLIKNPKKTEDARLLIDDLFEYYDLDKEIMDILPDYITKENIDLYDRVKVDLKDVDINYVLDNEVLKYIPDRLTDSQIDKSRVLIDDYDELQTLDMDKYDTMLDIINDYDELQTMIDASANLYDSIKEHDAELDTLEKSSKYFDSVFQIMDSADEQGLSMDINPEDMQVMLQALVEHKTKQISQPLTELIPDNGILNQEQQRKLTGLLNKALQAGKISKEEAQQLQVVINEGTIPLEVKAKMQGMITEMVGEQVYSEVDSVATRMQSIINQIQELIIEMEVDIGYNYRADLRASLEYINFIMPDLSVIRNEDRKHEETIRKAIDLVKNHDDMKYYQHWANRAKEMKEDMDDNEENIEIMRDILQEYDDPKISYFYSQIPKLREDMEEVRPIANALSDDLDIEKYNISLHKSPDTIATLMDMKEHLDANKYISDALKLSLDDDLVDSARKLLEVIDRRDAQKDLDEAREKIDDVDDMMDRKDAVIELSDQYTTFSGKVSDMNSKVTFVMKTDELKMPEEKEEFVPQEEKRIGFFEWIKGLFSKKEKQKK